MIFFFFFFSFFNCQVCVDLNLVFVLFILYLFGLVKVMLSSTLIYICLFTVPVGSG
jgi:hypothetical protein